MDGMRTLGQPSAVAAVRAMLGSGIPHAVLLVGPAGVGKTTLALDIAAALLCSAENPADRPCRACPSCRMVDHGNHPDLHVLAPSGAGSMIPIGGRGESGIRDVVHDLALLPVQGGARVAIIEAGDRMSEDAQSAFLKTLEEPPAGTTIIVCADDEERLLPTIRSRCARVRLGSLGIRDVEAVLAAQGVADPPLAARLARITDGRPGRAIAYALAPDAATIHAEISRTLLDLLDGGVTARLVGVRDMAGRATALVKELDAGASRASALGQESGDHGPAPTAARARGARGGRGVGHATVQPSPSVGDANAVDAAADEPAARVPAAERRRGALALVGIWRSVVRDLALAGHGAGGSVRDVELLDDLAIAAGRVQGAVAGELLRELDTAGERLEGNVSPELVLDALALRWTSRAGAA